MRTVDGTITRNGDKQTVRFERRLPHRPELVWRMLTDNEELAYWFPARIDGERKQGAKLTFTFFDKPLELIDEGLRAVVRKAHEDAATWPAGAMAGEMRIYDPPKLLELEWGGEVLRFELHARDGATVLVFTHTLGAEPTVVIAATAGWHSAFDALAGRMAGDQRQATKAEVDALEAEYKTVADQSGR